MVGTHSAGYAGLVGRIRASLVGDVQARKVRAAVLRLALPSIGEQVLAMTVQLVNTYLIGHLDPASLTAVGLANGTTLLVQTLIMALATGTTALVARETGAGNRGGASRIMQQSLIMGVSAGAALTILIGTFASQAIAFYGPAEDVAAIGERYLRIATLSFALRGVLLVGNAALRGAGDTRTPLFLMIGVNGINVLTSPALLRGLGPLPRLGALGPAWGSALSFAAGGLTMLALLGRGRAHLRLRRYDWRPGWPDIARVLNIGAPAGAEQFAMRTGQVLFSRVVTGLGTVAYAAHQVAITGQSLSFMPGFGFSVAATALVGQSLGADDPERARLSVRESLRMAVALMGSMGVLLVAFAPQVMGVFVSDPAVVAQGVAPSRLLGLLEPVLAAMMIYSGALRGAGDTRWTLLITGASIWLVRLPLAWLLTGPMAVGLLGAWMALGTDMSCRALLYWLRFRTGGWARLRV